MIFFISKSGHFLKKTGTIKSLLAKSSCRTFNFICCLISYLMFNKMCENGKIDLYSINSLTKILYIRDVCHELCRTKCSYFRNSIRILKVKCDRNEESIEMHRKLLKAQEYIFFFHFY